MGRRKSYLSTLVKKGSRAARLLGDDQIVKNSTMHSGRRIISEREYKARYTEIIRNREEGEDSGFEEPKSGDSCWPTMNRHPEFEDYDQKIFHIFGEKVIPTQKRKVKTSLVIVVKDCPEKAEDIKEYSKSADPILSKANVYKLPSYDGDEREKEMNRILLEGAAELKTYPRIYDEDALMEMWLDKRAAINAAARKRRSNIQYQKR